jgi:hypothetical protein
LYAYAENSAKQNVHTTRPSYVLWQLYRGPSRLFIWSFVTSPHVHKIWTTVEKLDHFLMCDCHPWAEAMVSFWVVPVYASSLIQCTLCMVAMHDLHLTKYAHRVAQQKQIACNRSIWGSGLAAQLRYTLCFWPGPPRLI